MHMIFTSPIFIGGIDLKVTEEIKKGFWIKSKTFRKNSVRKEVPDNTIIVTSSKKELEDGREVFEKSFYVAKEEGPEKIGKKDASVFLATQMLEFMLENQQWTPNTEIKNIQKNGKVKLSFKPDQFIEFNLIFDATVNEQSTEDFLKSLAEAPKIKQIWRVEYAKSSRSTCRGCEWSIEKGSIRVGEPSMYRDHLTYKWYHIDCAQEKGFRLDPVEGLEDLTQEERIKLLKVGLI